MVAPFSSWPWENFGVFKYFLYGPLLANGLYSFYEEGNIVHNWCLHILLISVLRVGVHAGWSTYSNMLFLTRKRRIVQQGVDFKQIDMEWEWDNFLLLQALMASMIVYMFPWFGYLPLWNSKGLIAVLILHVGIAEPLFYMLHRFFHTHFLFTHYHSLHHSSPVPQSFTDPYIEFFNTDISYVGYSPILRWNPMLSNMVSWSMVLLTKHHLDAGNGTLLEHLAFSLVIGAPIVGTTLLGYGSTGMIFCYVLAFDFLRCLGLSNVEIVPHRLFEEIPFLKYLLYTPTYHTLHHTEKGSNFCLFMPLFDVIGNTLHKNSWELHKEISSNPGKNVRVPDFVFLAHVVDITSSMHAPFVSRFIASKPFVTKLSLLPLWPVAFIVMLYMWCCSKTILYSFYNLRNWLYQTWAVPRFGFQYFLPFAREGINKHIEDAILRADKLGVKVISLAALNKNEALNGGGTLFVEKHPNLRVRVVHGNTLTAAVILNEIPKDVEEVFLTGATSKLGRAIALYLCRRKVRVLMLTLSTERFEKIQKEAPADCQNYLVQVTKYQAARNCKSWIVGKWITPSEQSWAPSGAHFHQFVVPPILAIRRDCTYGDLAAMHLPDDVKGLGYCEYTMSRGVVHACHAGGVVHHLEGWTHHEVGALDVDRIDMVWEAALKHGLKPVSSI